MSMPDDLRRAYETFTLLATAHKISFAGLAIGMEPPAVYAIGNVTERGHDLAELLRKYADLIDTKTDAGLIASDTPRDIATLN